MRASRWVCMTRSRPGLQRTDKHFQQHHSTLSRAGGINACMRGTNRRKSLPGKRCKSFGNPVVEVSRVFQKQVTT